MLADRERRVLELRFGLNGEAPRTLDEVGRAFNVTRERIRQIENQSLKKLRALARGAEAPRRRLALALGSGWRDGWTLPPVTEAWFDELAEFLRIPSVSADPAHAADVKRAGEWVRDFIRGAGGEAELDRLARPAARDRRDPRLGRRRRADRPLLRPLRRAAAGAARALGERAVRAGDPRRLPLRARHRRRQGAALHAARGRARAARGRRAAGQRPLLLRRRGGDRRALDRRLPRGRRARRATRRSSSTAA